MRIITAQHVKQLLSNILTSFHHRIARRSSVNFRGHDHGTLLLCEKKVDIFTYCILKQRRTLLKSSSIIDIPPPLTVSRLTRKKVCPDHQTNFSNVKFLRVER